MKYRNSDLKKYKYQIALVAVAFTLLLYIVPLNNMGLQQTSADSISDTIKKFVDRGGNDTGNDEQSSNDENERETNNINDIISQFTNIDASSDTENTNPSSQSLVDDNSPRQNSINDIINRFGGVNPTSFINNPVTGQEDSTSATTVFNPTSF